MAAGLEELDPGWAKLGVPCRDGEGFFAGGIPEPRTVCLLVGDIASSNNVAFTEAYRMRRKGLLDLWIAGHDDEVSRRVASRVVPELAGLGEAVASAQAEGKQLEILVNPEEIHRAQGRGGEESVLEVLGEACAAGRARITLLWNSRNAGYLLSKLAGSPGAAGRKADLFLDVGVEDGEAAVQRIVWGKKAADKALSLPLPRELWLRGRSYPSGRGSLEVDSVDEEAIREQAGVIAGPAGRRT